MQDRFSFTHFTTKRNGDYLPQFYYQHTLECLFISFYIDYNRYKR